MHVISCAIEIFTNLSILLGLLVFTYLIFDIFSIILDGIFKSFLNDNRAGE